MFAVKLATVSIMRRALGAPPVLLLDDVMSDAGCRPPWTVAREREQSLRRGARRANDPHARLDWKFCLTRRLFERGYDRQQIIGLYRFIDWVMALPEVLELEYDRLADDLLDFNDPADLQRWFARYVAQ